MRRACFLLAAALVGYALLSLALLQLEAGVEARSGYVFIDGTPVYYAEWSSKDGPRKGAAVLLHGLGGSLEMMRWLGLELARSGYRVIAYDNLGHGRSGSRIAMFNGTAAVQVYFRLLEALGVPEGERITLVGHSMGGFFAQEIAKRDPRVEKVFVVASRPYLDIPIERVAIFAGLDEIFSVTLAPNWTTIVLPYDDHLTVLYDPALIDIVLARMNEGHRVTLAPQRLLLTAARSVCAVIAALAAVHLLASHLGEPLPGASGGPPLAKVFAAAALAAPLTFPLYILMAPAVSLIAAYVLAVLYAQAIALIAVLRPRLSRTRFEARGFLRHLAVSASLALVVYAGLHEALQPFFNVEPGPQRAPLLVTVFVLSLAPALVFEPQLRLKLRSLSLKRGLAAVIALRVTSFLAAYATARLALGPGGLAGYLLIVTFVSLILLLPLDTAAQVWLHRTGSWSENAVWLALVHSVLLTAVTPLT